MSIFPSNSFSLTDDTSPHMHLYRMVGSRFQLWRLILLAEWVPSMTLKLDRHFITPNYIVEVVQCMLRCNTPLQSFHLVASRIIWQYLEPWNVHPSLRRHLYTVDRLRCTPLQLSVSSSCVAVVSSFACIFASTMRKTSGETMVCLTKPGFLKRERL